MDLDPQHGNIQQCRTDQPPKCGRDKIVKVSQQDSKMGRNLWFVILSLAVASGGAQSYSQRKDKCSVSKLRSFLFQRTHEERKKEARQGGTYLSSQCLGGGVGQSGVQGHLGYL